MIHQHQNDDDIMSFEEWQFQKYQHQNGPGIKYHDQYDQHSYLVNQAQNKSPYQYPDLSHNNQGYQLQKPDHIFKPCDHEFNHQQDILNQKGKLQQVINYDDPKSYEQYNYKNQKKPIDYYNQPKGLPKENSFHSKEYTYTLPQKVYLSDKGVITDDANRQTGLSEYQESFYKQQKQKKLMNLENQHQMYFDRQPQVGHEFNRDMRKEVSKQNKGIQNQHQDIHHYTENKFSNKSTYQDFHDKKEVNVQNVLYPQPRTDINPQDKDTFRAKAKMEGYKQETLTDLKGKKKFQ